MWPAVQFYSSGRTVRLLKVEAQGVAVTAVPQTPVCSLTESEWSVGYGNLGKAGDLGYSYGESRKVAFKGCSSAFSLSMHPPPNHDGKVSLDPC